MDARLQTKLDIASWCREQAAKKPSTEDYWRGHNDALNHLAESQEEMVDEVLNNRLGAWHDSLSTQPCYEYMGMTWVEYKTWVENEKPTARAPEQSGGATSELP